MFYFNAEKLSPLLSVTSCQPLITKLTQAIGIIFWKHWDVQHCHAMVTVASLGLSGSLECLYWKDFSSLIIKIKLISRAYFHWLI